MGAKPSTPKPTLDLLSFTTDPPATSAPFSTNCPTKNSKVPLHLILAFFAGILLTLLLMGFVFLIIKSYRKCHSSSPALDPCSDSPNKFPVPEEALTYASMTFKTSEEKNNHLTTNCSAGLDSTVYTQIKVTN
ncbi:transmembrane protein C1orf162 homolog isoform X2 [Tamandua tetradactyla]